jgi:LysR family transcriptional activator of mexEF-oprN operon
LLDRLDTGDADLALSATPTKGIERRHMVQPLHREGFAVLFDPEQVGLNDVIGLDEYLDLPHLLLSIDGELRGPIDDRLEELGRARTVLAAVSHFPTLPFILKRCRAIVNVPGIAAGYFAKAYDLRVCSLPIEIEDFEVSLIWHSRTHQDAASRWFRGLVADLVSELRSGMSLPRGGEREAARRASG